MIVDASFFFFFARRAASASILTQNRRAKQSRVDWYGFVWYAGYKKKNVNGLEPAGKKKRGVKDGDQYLLIAGEKILWDLLYKKSCNYQAYVESNNLTAAVFTHGIRASKLNLANRRGRFLSRDNSSSI